MTERRYKTNDVIEGRNGVFYRFIGSTTEDEQNPKMFVPLPPVQKQNIPNMTESARQELASGKYGALSKLALGAAAGLDRYAYGAKKAIVGLLPEEQQALDVGRAVTETTPGQIGKIALDTAVQLPAYNALGAAAALGPASARTAANIAGSGLIGGATGAISNPEDRFTGALHGGTSAMLGAAISSGATGAFAPKQGSAAEALMQSGGRPTPGQSAGGLVKSIEDAVRPINPQIGARQQEGIGAWNRLMVNNALKKARLPPITEKISGHELMQEAQQRLSSAYQQVGTRPVFADKQFTQDVRNLRAASMPYLKGDSARQVNNLIDEAIALTRGGKNTSAVRDFETINLSNVIQKSDSSQVREAARLLKSHLENLRDRVGAGTPDLDAGYAEFARMKEAAAGQAAMDTGLFSPGQLRGAVKRKSSIGQRAKGQALLQGDVASAEEMLGDTIPKVGPGTAEKGFWLGTLPAAGAASYYTGNALPLAVAGSALLANKLAYTRPGVGLLTGAYPWQQALMRSNFTGLPPALLSAYGNREE